MAHRAQPRPAARHGLRLPRPTPGPTTWSSPCGPTDDDALARAVAALEQALAAASAGSSGEARRRAAAAHGRRPRPAAPAVPTSRWCRCPGRTRSPRRWTRSPPGCSVLVFSDNVPVEQEVRLKDEAARRGLLVMGPDCGTAVVGGVGLGFANVVRPGPVGHRRRHRHRRAAADVPARHAARSGVSHCLGVGGRDLSAAVAGRSTRAALALLDDDPATELDRAGVQAAGPGGRRRHHGVRRVAGARRAAGAARRGGSPT